MASVQRPRSDPASVSINPRWPQLVGRSGSEADVRLAQHVPAIPRIHNHGDAFDLDRPRGLGGAAYLDLTGPLLAFCWILPSLNVTDDIKV